MKVVISSNSISSIDIFCKVGDDIVKIQIISTNGAIDVFKFWSYSDMFDQCRIISIEDAALDFGIVIESEI